MKFKSDDSVWYDDNHLIIVAGYPGPPGAGKIQYLVYNPANQSIVDGVWESDLMSHEDYRELALDWGQSGPVVI